MYVATFLFFASLIKFLFLINDKVVTIIFMAVCILGAIYIHCHHFPPCVLLSMTLPSTADLVYLVHRPFSPYWYPVLNHIFQEHLGQDQVVLAAHTEGFLQPSDEHSGEQNEINEKALKLVLTLCDDDGIIETL
jgi:hypothetical protein